MTKKKSTFETLYSINVNENTEKKGKLTYLSWAWAWAEFCKEFPDAKYGVIKTRDKNGIWQPYTASELGIMCETWVQVSPDEPKKPMWLPVMDNNNNPMKFEPYTHVTSWGKKIQVQAATMFDINKTLMRCFTKNLSMFGLGLYIYAGEDLPEVDKEKPQEEPDKEVKQRPFLKSGTANFNKAIDGIKAGRGTVEQLLQNFQLTKPDMNLLMKAVDGNK